MRPDGGRRQNVVYKAMIGQAGTRTCNQQSVSRATRQLHRQRRAPRRFAPLIKDTRIRTTTEPNRTAPRAANIAYQPYAAPRSLGRFADTHPVRSPASANTISNRLATQGRNDNCWFNGSAIKITHTCILTSITLGPSTPSVL